MIYLAQPYSHPDPVWRERRYAAGAAVCAHLFRQGKHVYAPIVHWHEVAKLHELPSDAAAWEAENLHFLEKATAMYILCIPGWKESKGLWTEVNYAAAAGKAVYTIESPEGTTDHLQIALVSPQKIIKLMEPFHGQDNPERGPGRTKPTPVK